MAIPFSNSLCNLLNSGNFGCERKKVYPGEILAPWVRATFEVSGVEITVGNQSAPDSANRAVIKDFEFGHSNGLECRITIVDEQGGDFVKFMEDLLKDFKCTTPARGYFMHVDFGWIREGCSSAYPLIKNVQTYNINLRDVENGFSGGKFVYEIIGQDIAPTVFQSTTELVVQSTLTQAITQMFTDPNYPPSVASVKFQRYTPNGGVEPLRFKHHDGDPLQGPKGYWPSQNMDKLNCAINWLRTWATANEKGIFATFNSEAVGGEIIFWEDPTPNCDETVNWDANCIGTYIVNSGQDTSVLDFSYTASWNFSNLANAGGGMGENTVLQNTDGGKQKGLIDCGTLNRAAVPTAGQKVSTNVTDLAKDKLGPTSAQETANAQTKQLKAFDKFNLFQKAITANLTIMGDPTLIRPSQGLVGKTVTIIFLNPYYLLSNGSQCGEWLSGSMCNAVLSNKGWFVQSISHRISEGKFTTTLGLHLPAPGLDIDVGQPFGGAGSGGWVPPRAC